LTIALLADGAVGVILGLSGLLNMPSLSLYTMVFSISVCMFAVLVINESAKLLLLKMMRASSS